jgi:hypothetical protein
MAINDPHEMADYLIGQHNIEPNFDDTVERHTEVSLLISNELGKLSCAELGELICTNQDDANAEDYVGVLVAIPEGTNFRGFLEHTASYIVDMVMHQKLNPNFSHN